MHRAFDARLKPQNPCARVAHFRKSIMDRLTTLHWAKSRLENGGQISPLLCRASSDITSHRTLP